MTQAAVGQYAFEHNIAQASKLFVWSDISIIYFM